MQETIVGGSGGCRVRQSGRTDDARVIKATDAIYVGATLPATPSVRKQKSIAFSMLSPKSALR